MPHNLMKTMAGALLFTLAITSEASAEVDGYFDQIKIMVDKNNFYMPLKVFVETKGQRCGGWRITGKDVDKKSDGKGYITKPVTDFCKNYELEKIAGNRAWIFVHGNPSGASLTTTACSGKRKYEYKEGVNTAVKVYVYREDGVNAGGTYKKMVAQCEGLESLGGS